MDISCDVAPGIVFYSAYECDSEWEERGSYSASVDTSDAGATVVIADGSKNSVSGTNIYRMLRTKYKDDDSTDEIKVQKKMCKDDGINTNEDGVSVTSFVGGSVEINAALGAEGDGVDSNGFILIDGGTLSVNGIRPPDSALDSDSGVHYQSGSVTFDGEEQSYNPSDEFRESGGMGGFGGSTPPAQP